MPLARYRLARTLVLAYSSRDNTRVVDPIEATWFFVPVYHLFMYVYVLCLVFCCFFFVSFFLFILFMCVLLIVLVLCL